MRKKGSYTIELTLLMPVIIAVILLILFSNYYMHDRVIIEKANYISCLRGALCYEKEKRESVAMDAFVQQIDGKLLGKWDYNIKFVNAEDKVISEFEGKMKMNEGLLLKVIGERVYTYKTKAVSDSANESIYIRKNAKDK